ncbi:Cof-type HAD-IIB family hydrolase [Thomasclavelia sp.]
MIKGIFFDVDGTLISRKRSYISDSVLMALNRLREQGVKLFIATGRHYIELEKLGINKQFTFDGYLTLNGGYCFNHEEAIYSNPIDKDDVAKIVEYIINHDLACSFVETDDLYVNKIDDLVIDAQIFLNTSLPPVKDITKALDNNVYQIDPFVTLDEIKNIMKLTKCCKYTQWYETGYDIIPKAGGKHEGIKAMLDYYKFDKSEIMAFGDGHNDIEMLMFAGIGVCMENGHEETKNVSDFITKSVDEDGIVTALDHFSLI